MISLIRTFAGALLLAMPLSAQEGEPATPPALNGELLHAHPAALAGDVATAAESWLVALEADPENPLAVDVLYRLTVNRLLSELFVDPQRLLTLEPRLTDPFARLVCRELIEGELLRYLLDPWPARLPGDLFSDHASLWRTLGPLGAPDHPAPLRDAPPRDAPEAGLQEAHVDALGRAKTWQLLRRDPHERLVRPDLVLPGRRGLVYAAAFFHLALEEGAAADAVYPARLRLAVQDSQVRVSVNGAPLGEWLREDVLAGRCELTAEVGLTAGWNHVLLALDLSGLPEVGAQLELLDGGAELRADSGEPLADLLAGAARPAPCGPLELLAPAALPADDPFLAALQVERPVLFYRPDQGLAVPAPAEQEARRAWSRARHLVLSAASHLGAEYVRREQQTLEEELLAAGALGAVELVQRAGRLASEDRPRIALDELDAAQGVLLTDSIRPQILGALDRSGYLQGRECRRLAELYPDSPRVQLLLARALNREGDTRGALDAAWRSLEQDGNQEGARDLVLRLMADAPDDPRRVALLSAASAWRRLFPGSIEGRRFEREVLEALEADTALLPVLTADTVRTPHKPDVWRSLADFHLVRGQSEPARRAVEALLALRPGHPWGRACGLELGIEDPAEAFFARTLPDVAEARALAVDVRDASVAEALDSGQIYVYADGSRVERTHTLSIALDRKGTEELHERPLVGKPRVARVLQVGGGEAEPVVVGESWVMPSLDPGDAVELIYDQRYNSLEGVAPDIGWWRFASFERPFVVSRYALFVAEGVPGELRTFHFDGSHDQSEFEGGRLHVLRTEGRPRQQAEPLMPSYQEVLPWLHYGGDKPIGHVQAYQLSVQEIFGEAPADLAPELAAFVREHDVEGDVATRAAALWAALEGRLRDFSGSVWPGSVWYEERGEPLPLYALLLQEAGIPFLRGVVERPASPELDPEPFVAFENSRGFNLQVLAIEQESGRLLWQVRPNGKGAPFGRVPDAIAGARVLLTTRGEPRFEELPRDGLADSYDVDLEVDWILQPNGDGLGVVRFAMTNSQGGAMREQLAQASLEQRGQVARQIAANFVPGLDLAEFDFPGLADAGGSLRVELKGTLPGLIQQVGQGHQLGLRMPPTGLSTGLGAARRRWPLALRASQSTRVRVTIDPGEAWLVAGVPEGFELVRDGFQHSLQYSREEALLLVERRFGFRGLTLPAEEMPAFLERCGELEREQTRPVLMEPRE